MIKAGDEITCTAGHVICRAAMDINHEDVLSQESFTGWTIPVPFASINPACHCGAMWVDGGPYSVSLYVNGRWCG